MSWRKNLFVEGDRYRVKRSFALTLWTSWTFNEGEIVKFVRNFYSHYDGLSLYEFQSEADNKIKYWALPDSDTPDSWQDCFELVTKH